METISVEKLAEMLGILKHGHWDFLSMRDWDGVPEYYANCSKCGYREKAYTRQFVIDNWHYCPHCGAKMDGKRKDDEQIR